MALERNYMGGIKMKNKIISITLTLICSTCAFSQSFMTNSVNEISVPEIGYGGFLKIFRIISKTYNVRICTEDNTGEFWSNVLEKYQVDENFWNKNRLSEEDYATLDVIDKMHKKKAFPSTTFTNATFETVFGAVMESMTNHVWRYEAQTDSIYVYPSTNALSMMRCGSVSLKNEPFLNLFNENGSTNGIALFTEHKVGVSGGYMDLMSWMFVGLTIELEDPYVWQVFDAIIMKYRHGKFWEITRTSDSYNPVHFYGPGEELRGGDKK